MPVRYGVIGCGAIAQRRHIPECAANPASKVAAIADPVRVMNSNEASAAAQFVFMRVSLSSGLRAQSITGPSPTSRHDSARSVRRIDLGR